MNEIKFGKISKSQARHNVECVTINGYDLEIHISLYSYDICMKGNDERFEGIVHE
jgi:hypothetical protein